MTDGPLHLSYNMEALRTLRDPRLNTALSAWFGGASSGNADVDRFIGEMRRHAEKLGWIDMLSRLGSVKKGDTPSAPDSSGSAALIHLARGILDGALSFDQAIEMLRALPLADDARAILCLYVSCDRDLILEGVQVIVLRLAADTAQDNELAARIYSTLGRSMGSEPSWAVHAFSAGLERISGGVLPALQASLCLDFARCCSQIGRMDDAIEAARVASLFAEKGGAHESAEAATIFHATLLIETNRLEESAHAIRPLVKRQLASGVEEASKSASIVLKECIRREINHVLNRLSSTEVADPVGDFEKALALAGSSGYVYPDEAADRSLLARLLAQKGRLTEGVRQMKRAVAGLETTGDPGELHYALSLLTDWLVHTEDEAALHYARRALELGREIADDQDLALDLVHYGNALRQNGNAADGLGYLREGAERSDRLAYRTALIEALIEANRAVDALPLVERSASGDEDLQEQLLFKVAGARAYRALGREDDANRLLHSMSQEFLSTGGDPAPRMLEAWGAQLLQSGQIAKATEALGEAVSLVAGQPLDRETARLRLLYGAALQMAGCYTEAAEILDDTLKQSRDQRVPSWEIVALYSLGENALAQREFDQALQYYQEAARRAEEEKDEAILGSSLNKIGATFTSLRQPERAIEFHERALAIHRAENYLPGVVVDLIQAAQSYLDVSDLEHAVACAEELSTLGLRYPPPDREWIPFVVGRVAAAQGDWARAKERFLEALITVENRRRLFRSLEAQRRWSVQKADTYGLIIEAAIAARAPADAIEFLELGRNRYLRELIRRRVDSAPSEEDIAQISSWRRLEPAAPRGYTVVWFGGFPRGLGFVSASRRDDGQLALDCRFDRSVTGQDLSDLFDGDLRAILAAHGEGRVVDYLLKTIVENRGIDLSANPYWQNREGWEESLKKVCDFLRRHVWPHILEMAGGHSADFLLLPSVGCSEMPSAAAAPDALADGRPISVCVAPSLSILAERMNDAATTVSAQSSLAQAVNPSEDSELPCCTIEARLSAEAFEGQVSPLRGRKATRQRVLDALAGNDVFHFIGHAFVDWKDPLDSGLVCAAQKNEPGVLTVREILQTLGGIQTKVIILSACQIGHVQPGDRLNDFLNLPAALVAAGARTVVAPRWQVDDMATALLISKLITGWIRGGLTIPRALAEARRWLRDEITTDLAVAWIDAALDDPFVDRDTLRRLRNRYTERFEPADHPFAHERHWGAFEVVGSPTP